jgi:hypothetical protein
MIRDRPGRFGGFACLPLPDVEGALAELAYALDDLGLDGVLPFGNARGILLGGPAVHPRCSTSCNGARPWCSRIPIPRPIPAPRHLGENFAVSEIESDQQARNELAACGLAAKDR